MKLIDERDKLEDILEKKGSWDFCFRIVSFIKRQKTSLKKKLIWYMGLLCLYALGMSIPMKL